MQEAGRPVEPVPGLLQWLLSPQPFEAYLGECAKPLVNQTMNIRGERLGVRRLVACTAVAYYSRLRRSLLFRVCPALSPQHSGVAQPQHKKIFLDSSSVELAEDALQPSFADLATHLLGCLRLVDNRIRWMNDGDGICGYYHGKFYRVETREKNRVLTFR